MSLECEYCDGKGGYPVNHESDEIEDCDKCGGDGQARCGFCDGLAIGHVREPHDGKLQKIAACESCYKDFPADDRCAT